VNLCSEKKLNRKVKERERKRSRFLADSTIPKSQMLYILLCALSSYKRTYSCYGNRCFAAANPELWNNLLAHLRQSDNNFEQFKLLLEHFCSGVKIAASYGAPLTLLKCPF